MMFDWLLKLFSNSSSQPSIDVYDNHYVVPAFNTYFPEVSELDENQKRFYDFFCKNLNNGTFIDVQGTISYIFERIK